MLPTVSSTSESDFKEDAIDILFTTRTLLKMALRRLQNSSDSIGEELIENSLAQLDSLSDTITQKPPMVKVRDECNVDEEITSDQSRVVSLSRMSEDIWSLQKEEIVVLLNERDEGNREGTST